MNSFRTIVRVAVVLGAIVMALPMFPPKLRATAVANDPPSTIPQLERAVPELMKKSNVSGVSIALIRHGKTVWVHGFGVKEAGTSQPVTSETVFEAASLGKPVFAYGVLKLVDQGRLGLDVPLTTYLPKPYIAGDQRLAKITARIVLSHRTGFPNWPADGDSSQFISHRESGLATRVEGYIYLQRVVEQITGKPLNQYMTEAVFTPLGMTSSSYVWRPDFDALTATGHDPDGKPTELWKPTEAGAASTLNTTAKDYALFVEAVLNGKGLRPETLREMETPANRARSGVQDLHQAASRSSYRRICFGDWDGAFSAQMEVMRSGIGETTAHSSVS